MVLPKFRSSRKQAQRESTLNSSADTEKRESADGNPTSPASTYVPGVDLKKATKTRKHAIALACSFFFISVIFLLLTIIGNINKKAVVRDTWFFKLDLTNIIPASTDGITLVNSLARSLGLHDFYQVGLWNFCEGYNDEGITRCSSPKTLYWFNPVQIILNELLSGATVALPNDINNILRLIRIASNVMFGCFLTGICMNVVSIFVTPVVLYSRWWSFPIAIWTFTAALLTTIATVIATVMFIIFRNVITSQDGLNIGAEVGTQMFAFMWVGCAFTIFGFAIHLGLSCCCASRRDVKTGRRKGNKAAYGDSTTDTKKQPLAGRFNMPKFRRVKASGAVV